MIFDDFLRGRRRARLEPTDLAALEASVNGVRTIPRRHLLVRASDPIAFSTYLIDGFICRYMDDREGNRQLVAVHVPGDFVDLHGYPLGYLDHDIAALTKCKIALVPHANLDRLVATRPGLAKLLWFSTLLDAAMHREWIFRLGRLEAIARIGHFFCELEARLHAVGMSDGKSFDLPMTQADLGEVCGMTAVHMNRMLRQLREMGLLSFKNQKVTILDQPKLMRLCEFDPAYLFFGD